MKEKEVSEVISDFLKFVRQCENDYQAAREAVSVEDKRLQDLLHEMEFAEGENAPVVVICGKIESEIAALESEEDRKEFLEASGLTESGLNPLIRAAYKALGLRTFFTAGPDEDRAWTFHEGSKAPQCAGIIHTDFEKGFIKAEVYSVDDLIKYGSEAHVREAGKLRLEGKEYIVQDGDIVFFRFNV